MLNEVKSRSAEKLESKVPPGKLEEKWTNHRFKLKLINPANKRKYNIIVVGTGLAGASAAASLAELGYNVKAFCFQDSARRAHSIAAQEGFGSCTNTEACSAECPKEIPMDVIATLRREYMRAFVKS